MSNSLTVKNPSVWQRSTQFFTFENRISATGVLSENLNYKCCNLSKSIGGRPKAVKKGIN